MAIKGFDWKIKALDELGREADDAFAHYQEAVFCDDIRPWNPRLPLGDELTNKFARATGIPVDYLTGSPRRMTDDLVGRILAAEHAATIKEPTMNLDYEVKGFPGLKTCPPSAATRAYIRADDRGTLYYAFVNDEIRKKIDYSRIVEHYRAFQTNAATYRTDFRKLIGRTGDAAESFFLYGQTPGDGSYVSAEAAWKRLVEQAIKDYVPPQPVDPVDAAYEAHIDSLKQDHEASLVKLDKAFVGRANISTCSAPNAIVILARLDPTDGEVHYACMNSDVYHRLKGDDWRALDKEYPVMWWVGAGTADDEKGRTAGHTQQAVELYLKYGLREIDSVDELREALVDGNWVGRASGGTWYAGEPISVSKARKAGALKMSVSKESDRDTAWFMDGASKKSWVDEFELWLSTVRVTAPDTDVKTFVSKATLAALLADPNVATEAEWPNNKADWTPAPETNTPWGFNSRKTTTMEYYVAKSVETNDGRVIQCCPPDKATRVMRRRVDDLVEYAFFDKCPVNYDDWYDFTKELVVKGGNLTASSGPFDGVYIYPQNVTTDDIRRSGDWVEAVMAADYGGERTAMREPSYVVVLAGGRDGKVYRMDRASADAARNDDAARWIAWRDFDTDRIVVSKPGRINRNMSKAEFDRFLQEDVQANKWPTAVQMHQALFDWAKREQAKESSLTPDATVHKVSDTTDESTTTGETTMNDTMKMFQDAALEGLKDAAVDTSAQKLLAMAADAFEKHNHSEVADFLRSPAGQPIAIFLLAVAANIGGNAAGLPANTVDDITTRAAQGAVRTGAMTLGGVLTDILSGSVAELGDLKEKIAELSGQNQTVFADATAVVAPAVQEAK